MKVQARIVGGDLFVEIEPETEAERRTIEGALTERPDGVDHEHLAQARLGALVSYSNGARAAALTFVVMKGDGK